MENSDSHSPLQRVRTSCIALNADEVQIDRTAIDSFVASSDVQTIKSLGSSLAESLCKFPITYESPKQEVSFIAVCHALDFGSGFRKQLHRFHGKGAWNTVKDGLCRMYEANKDFTSEWMSNVTQADMESYFLPGLSDWQTAENSDEIGELTKQKLQDDNTMLNQLIKMFTECVHELGTALLARGYGEMNQLIDYALAQEAESGKLGGGANAIVDCLVSNFPTTFNDRYQYTDGSDVCLYKKAQLVTGELYHRFRGEDSRFDFKDANQLTPYVDNVIVATMRKSGTIKPVDWLDEMIDNGQPLPRGSPSEVALRAKSLHAIDLITQGFHKLLNDGSVLLPCEVGNYLWAVLGKEPNFRSFERHATPDTCYY